MIGYGDGPRPSRVTKNVMTAFDASENPTIVAEALEYIPYFRDHAADYLPPAKRRNHHLMSPTV
jgi:hypothetical protein